MKSRQNGDLYEPGSPGSTVYSVSTIPVVPMTQLTFLIPVAFDVPVGEDIALASILCTSSFDLLETPLRQIDVTRTQVAAEISVSQSKGGRECADLGVIAGSSVTDDFNDPMILGITDRCVAVTGNFVVSFCDGSSDLVRVEVAAGLCVDEADCIAIAGVSQRLLRFVVGLVASRVEEPVIVGILVVVAGDLLLLRAFRVCLDVGMKKTTAVSHVLQCCS